MESIQYIPVFQLVVCYIKYILVLVRMELWLYEVHGRLVRVGKDGVQGFLVVIQEIHLHTDPRGKTPFFEGPN